jgi:hypothetical protein|tara:strand:+ start:93 stop:410 length:318 start_codon:yes stop_codon:yes gene_type:complete
VTKDDIKQSGDDVHVIGFINWSPEHWDYQTSDAEIDSLLGEVKAKGEVTGYTSFEDEDAIYCFVEDKVESSSPKFIGQLSDYLGRVTEMPGTGSIWIREQNNTED